MQHDTNPFPDSPGMSASGNSLTAALLAEQRWMQSIARALLEDRQAVDDVVQETVLAALRRRPESNRSLRPWLGTVLRNKVWRHRRRDADRVHGERSRASSTAEASMPSSEELTERLELRNTLVECLGSLREPYRTTLMLCYFEGRSPTQIAKAEGIPAATVRWRVKKGLELLRERLDERHVGDRAAWNLALLPLLQLEPHALVAGGSALLPSGTFVGLLAKIMLLVVPFAALLVTVEWTTAPITVDPAARPQESVVAAADEALSEDAAALAPALPEVKRVAPPVQSSVPDALAPDASKPEALEPLASNANVGGALRPAPAREDDATIANIPRSDALFAGIGDVYARELLAEAQLEGTGFGSLKDLAGSWIYLYEVNPGAKSAPARIDAANEIASKGKRHGVVVIAVVSTESSRNKLAPKVEHPIWVTRLLASGRGPDYGRPTLLDRTSPSEILIDPCGVIAFGGRLLPPLGGDRNHGPDKVIGLVEANPGIGLRLNPAGSKLRDLMARRKWSAARDRVEEFEKLSTRLDGILSAQVDWTEAHLSRNDVGSAATRLEALEGLGKKDALASRLSTHEDCLSRDAGLKAGEKAQKEILRVAQTMNDDLGFQKAWYSVKDYRAIDRSLGKLEKRELEKALGTAVGALREYLEKRSPHRPCKGCDRGVHDCKCK